MSFSEEMKKEERMKIDVNKLKEKLCSRKLWAAVIGFTVAIGAAFGMPEIDEEGVMLIASGCAALVAYIIGEGIADSGKYRPEDKDE